MMRTVGVFEAKNGFTAFPNEGDPRQTVAAAV